MNVVYKITSGCRSRIQFQPFSANEDRGVRCHSWLTSIFLRCLNKITCVTIGGKVHYLNRNSFEQWKQRQEKEFQSNQQFALPENAVKFYCSAKYEKMANASFADFKSEEGIKLLESAAKIDRQGFFNQRVEANKKLKECWEKAESASVIKAVNDAEKVLERWETTLKQAKSNGQPYSHTKQKIKLFSDLLAAFRSFCNTDRYGTIYDQLDRKEFDSIDGLNMKELRDQGVFIPNDLLDLRIQIEKHDAAKELFESRSLESLWINRKQSVLCNICQKVFGVAEKCFQAAHKQDEAINEETFKRLQNEANEYFAKGVLFDGLAKLDEASRIHDISDRIGRIRNLYRWTLQGDETANVKENPALISEIKGKLDKWSASLEAECKADENLESQRIIKQIIDALKAFVNSQDRFEQAFTKFKTDLGDNSKLLQSLNFNPESLRSQELTTHRDNLRWGTYSTDQFLTEPYFKSYALRVISKACSESLINNTLAYNKAEMLRKAAQDAFAKGDLETSANKYEEAMNAAPEKFKVELRNRMDIAYKFRNLARDHKIEILNMATKETELKSQLQSDLTKWEKEKEFQIIYGTSFSSHCQKLQQLFNRFKTYASQYQFYDIVENGIMIDLPRFNLDGNIRVHSYLHLSNADEEDFCKKLGDHIILQRMVKHCSDLYRYTIAYKLAQEWESKTNTALEQGKLEEAQDTLTKAIEANQALGKDNAEVKAIHEMHSRKLEDVKKLIEHYQGYTEEGLVALKKESEEKFAKIGALELDKVKVYFKTLGILKGCLVMLERSIQASVVDFKPAAFEIWPEVFHKGDATKMATRNDIKVGLHELNDALPQAKKTITGIRRFHALKALNQLCTEMYVVAERVKKDAETARKIYESVNSPDLEAAEKLILSLKDSTLDEPTKKHFESELQRVKKFKTWKEQFQKTHQVEHDEMMKYLSMSDEEQSAKVQTLIDEAMKKLNEFSAKLHTDQLSAGEKQLISFHKSIITYARDVTAMIKSSRGPQTLINTKHFEAHAGYISKLSAFDFDNWSKTFGEIDKESYKWLNSYNILQLRKLLEGFHGEYQMRVDSAKFEAQLDKEFEQKRFAEWQTILISPDIKFAIDNQSLSIVLPRLRDAILEENNQFMSSQKKTALTHKSMTWLQMIAGALGSKSDWKKPAPVIVEGNDTDLVLDKAKHKEFVDKLEVWKKLTDTQKDTKEGYDAKRAAITAFLELWLCVALKLKISIEEIQKQKSVVKNKVRQRLVANA